MAVPRPLLLDGSGELLGSPGCRLELLWKYGADAAEAFTDHYLSHATIDCARLPVWELYAASAAAASMGEWGLDPAREAEMRAKTASVIARASRAILQRPRSGGLDSAQ
jgi:hypothetical protein